MSTRQAVTPEAVNAIVERLKGEPGALLPILHAIQRTFSYIPPEAIEPIAKALKQTVAEVYGVISFYHYFRTSPPGRHILQICRGEACQARGSRELEKHVKSRLGVDYDTTTIDGEFSLSAVYCLGNCARGPSLRHGDKIEGDVTPEKFNALQENLTTVALEISE